MNVRHFFQRVKGVLVMAGVTVLLAIALGLEILGIGEDVEPQGEYVPEDGETIKLAIRDDRVESDVFEMPDE